MVECSSISTLEKVFLKSFQNHNCFCINTQVGAVISHKMAAVLLNWSVITQIVRLQTFPGEVARIWYLFLPKVCKNQVKTTRKYLKDLV